MEQSRGTGSQPAGLASKNDRRTHGEVESTYAWMRLALSLALSTIGGVGMWSVVVALPVVQAEFGVARGDASLPYTLTMIGFGMASILMVRLADRFGIMGVRHADTPISLYSPLDASAVAFREYWIRRFST